MTTIPIIPEVKKQRSCDGCTACCDGWLHATIHGIPMYPGRKCQWVGEKGCEIYPQRPKDPCHSFKCGWLENNNIPHWMKPSLSNVILVNRKTKNKEIDYVEVKEMGQKMDSTILNWLIQFYVFKNINIYYQVDGGWNWFGSNEFVEDLNSK